MRHHEDRLNDILAAVNDGAELVKRGHTAFLADPFTAIVNRTKPSDRLIDAARGVDRGIPDNQNLGYVVPLWLDAK